VHLKTTAGTVIAAALAAFFLAPAPAYAENGLQCGAATQLGPKTYIKACIERSGNWVRGKSWMINYGTESKVMRTSEVSFYHATLFRTSPCLTNSGWVTVPPATEFLPGSKMCETEWLLPLHPESAVRVITVAIDQQYGVQGRAWSPSSPSPTPPPVGG
jgi:hypothetical protein